MFEPLVGLFLPQKQENLFLLESGDPLVPLGAVNMSPEDAQNSFIQDCGDILLIDIFDSQ